MATIVAVSEAFKVVVEDLAEETTMVVLEEAASAMAKVLIRYRMLNPAPGTSESDTDPPKDTPNRGARPHRSSLGRPQEATRGR